MSIFDWTRGEKKPQEKAKERKLFDALHGDARVSDALNPTPRKLEDVIADIHKKLPRLPEAIRATRQAAFSAAMDSVAGEVPTMDDSSNGIFPFKALNAGYAVNEALISWYSSQTFIGWQLCAIIAQHWLINKCCSLPGRDAIRNGYDVVSIDGDPLSDEDAKLLRRTDRQFKLTYHLEEFVRFGRTFGIRVALFKVKSSDPDWYKNPFNIDGVEPGSYEGIVQIDPYWTGPILDMAATGSPDSEHFYEPTWWLINGTLYHRTHLVIYRHDEPADLIKPQYIYGGVPLPQQIMERVYAAERTANEAPQLAMTKRILIWLTDMSLFLSQSAKALARMGSWSAFMNNYGVKIGDKENEDFKQMDVSLADLDAVIMTQYQIVAAAACVPGTKLLGTVPKGFNSTGDYEEATYHEELESIQTHKLSPMIERHHQLVLASNGRKGIETTIEWRPCDSPTAQELAATNLTKAQTGVALAQSGAIDGEDERQRLAGDPSSGYHNLGAREVIEPLEGDEGGEGASGE